MCLLSCGRLRNCPFFWQCLWSQFLFTVTVPPVQFYDLDLVTSSSVTVCHVNVSPLFSHIMRWFLFSNREMYAFWSIHCWLQFIDRRVHQTVGCHSSWCPLIGNIWRTHWFLTVVPEYWPFQINNLRKTPSSWFVTFCSIIFVASDGDRKKESHDKWFDRNIS